jgi:NAD(P)-dependent dehydrogenase (short-subunit alcohol dehydrogenase family)
MATNNAGSRRGAGRLAGRHVVITGASSGIGRAAALAVAEEGATMLLIARRGAELDEVVREIRERGGSAFGYQCDVTDSESVDATIAAMLSEHGHVDMLVNNAGRSIRRALHRSTDRLHDFERTMAVNYFGALRMILGLLPSMRERKFGHIVNISTEGVQNAAPRFAAYLASKAALDKFTEVAAAEMLADRISFTTIYMPLVETPMIAPTHYGPMPARSPEWAAGLVVKALVKRPKKISTLTGTLSEYWRLVTPRTKDRILHEYYRRHRDSPAAKGELTQGQ